MKEDFFEKSIENFDFYIILVYNNKYYIYLRIKNMTNTNIKNINSVCTTPSELIKSQDFIR